MTEFTNKDNTPCIKFGGPHDVAGLLNHELDNNGKIETFDKPLQLWEYQMHALLVRLASHKPAFMTTDELRRVVEGLEPEVYKTWGYYEKWASAFTTILLERGVITQVELDEALSGDETSLTNENDELPVLFKEGDLVKVRSEDARLRWRRPHLRCPGYIFGLVGKIQKFVGTFDDPFALAFRGKAPKQPLYSVLFPMKSIWSTSDELNAATSKPWSADFFDGDCIEGEVYQVWLDPYTPSDGSDHDHHKHQHTHDEHCDHHKHEHEHEHEHEHGHGHDSEHRCEHHGHDEHHSHDEHHDHDKHHSHDEHHGHDEHHSHDHDHVHESRKVVERRAHELEGESDSPGKVIGLTLLRLLYKKGIVTPQEIAATVDKLENAGKRLAGAELVVRAWKDPVFKARLLNDAKSAADEVDIVTSNPNAPTVLRVAANEPNVHNLIVCTLCSCYPAALLGLSPSWYKSRNYRARAIREPRKVLEEFGLILPSTTRIVVHDSTADCRYMVLPQPPKSLSEEDIQRLSIEELMKYVTRDSMIGVAVL